MRMTIGLHVAATLTLCLCCDAAAMRVINIEPQSPQHRLREALADGDDRRAAEIIERCLAQHPNDPGMLYNAACLHARLGETDRGAGRLLDAIKAGFADFSRMRRDADLNPLREHRLYRTIMQAREAADPLLGERQLQQWLQVNRATPHRSATDPQRRINLAAAQDEPTFNQLQRSIATEFDHLQATLFPNALAMYALIVVPGEHEAANLLPNRHAAGHYHHGLRRLIARDTGRALRHELVHLLHHRHMDALGQQHPIWIQEGLATLYEQYELTDGQTLFKANDRDAAAQYLSARDQLRPWREVLAMSDDAFEQDAARLYPQVRSMFRFIHERVGVVAWYSRYVEGYVVDSTGAAALETAFALPVESIEVEWRQWLSEQPAGLQSSSQLVRIGCYCLAVCGKQCEMEADRRPHGLP